MWLRNIENIDFQNFENNPLVEYRLCRLLFGVSSSPFLLFATLIHHINKYKVAEPKFVEKLLLSLHVDDLSSGCENVDSGLEFYSKCIQALKEGAFNLRKFKSNLREFTVPINRPMHNALWYLKLRDHCKILKKMFTRVIKKLRPFIVEIIIFFNKNNYLHS